MKESEILQHLGIDCLNTMQQDTVAACRKSKKIILLSPTGSGKTLAFLLPLVSQIDIKNDNVQAIVIAPSRELAKQICRVLQDMRCGVRGMAVYGGRPAMEEHRSLRSNMPHVIIGTPGRLNDHISKENFSVCDVRSFVIDEFDKCLELGFQGEMQQLVSSLPKAEFQMLLSATDCPEIPQFIDIDATCTRLDYLESEEQIPDRINVKLVKSPIKDKLETLASLLSSLGQQSSIVFVGFRESVDRVTQFLNRNKFYVSDFHGGMEQDLRERALFRFSSGACNVLVSTDLAARGLDIPDVDNIIHYHLPLDEQAYVHRNGRTARWNASGNAFLILGPEEYLPDYIEGDVDEYVLPKEETAPMAPKWESLYIGRGKKDKLSKGDIAGFMMKVGGLSKDEVGRIEVRDHCAYVSVLRTRVKELTLRVRGQKIKGMKTIIEPTK